MDAPRTEQAFAAALPLAGLDAWRLYPGLPMCGVRSPALRGDHAARSGGAGPQPARGRQRRRPSPSCPPSSTRCGRSTASATGPSASSAGRRGRGSPGRPSSRGSSRLRAAVLDQPAPAAAAGRGGARDVLRDGLPLDARVRGGGRPDGPRRPCGGFAGLPVRLVVGAARRRRRVPSPGEDGSATCSRARGTAADLHVIEGMGHALAEEPGVEPAPQTPHAAQVDQLAVAWLAQAFELA